VPVSGAPGSCASGDSAAGRHLDLARALELAVDAVPAHGGLELSRSGWPGAARVSLVAAVALEAWAPDLTSSRPRRRYGIDCEFERPGNRVATRRTKSPLAQDREAPDRTDVTFRDGEAMRAESLRYLALANPGRGDGAPSQAGWDSRRLPAPGAIFERSPAPGWPRGGATVVRTP